MSPAVMLSVFDTSSNSPVVLDGIDSVRLPFAVFLRVIKVLDAETELVKTRIYSSDNVPVVRSLAWTKLSVVCPSKRLSKLENQVTVLAATVTAVEGMLEKQTVFDIRVKLLDQSKVTGLPRAEISAESEDASKVVSVAPPKLTRS
jgi:hypothetical protein